jgi:hypothetical protein
MTLNWQLRRNLENSLAEFLQTEAVEVTVFFKGSNTAIDIRVGNAPQDDWKLPNISIYLDTKSALRGFVGNNKRLKSYLMIIDIRALDDGMRSDLAEWVTDTINDGFDYYEYYPNPSSPDTINKNKNGFISVDFVSDNPLRPVIDADSFDKFRHNISVSLTIGQS